MFSTQNLSFKYNNRSILNDISVSFPEGSFTCIIGPNGAGKTTLLRLLAGIHKANSGKILLGDEEHKFDQSKDISYLPHRPDVLFPFTAFETISLGVKEKLISFKNTVSKESIFDAMEKVDCLEFSERLITELSAGEQQRVFIAQAIASDPKVLLLDEPTAALDLKHQLDLMDKLQNWAKSGKTIVAVIHDINLAASHAERLCMIKDGKIMAEGKSSKVFTEANIEKLFGVSVNVHSRENFSYWLPK